MFWKKKVGGAVQLGSSQEVLSRYNAGVGFLQVGNISEAEKIFAELAKEHHPSAMYNLALLYAQGHGSHLMLREATDLFRRGAELGHEGAATFCAYFTQYDHGFTANAGLSSLLALAGDGSSPALLIHAIAADIRLRLETKHQVYLYCGLELIKLLKSGERGASYVKSLGFTTKESHELLQPQEIEKDSSFPSLVSHNMETTVQRFIDEFGMAEETALFIRCSILGTLCSFYSFIEVSDLPPIEYFQQAPTARNTSMAINNSTQKKADGIQGYERGKELFELGVAEAQKANFAMAFEYYSKSIEACANPVPYLNRARILFKKLRYQEGLQDLLEAKRLDLAQGNEFGEELDGEINLAEFYTSNYRNGTRKKLLDDYKKNDVLFIARRIFCTSFKVERGAYISYDSPLVEFHFFNELDNVKRFEDLSVYPEVEEFLRDYPDDFIQMKIEANPNPQAYINAEMLLHNFLCSYDEKEMRYIRRNIIYDIHSNLMDNDYGYLGQGMGSDCPGVTKEAHEYIRGRARTTLHR